MRPLRNIVAATALAVLLAIPQAGAVSAEEIDFTLKAVAVGLTVSCAGLRSEFPADRIGTFLGLCR